MNHFVTAEDVANELCTLLQEAQKVYLQEVLESSKQYSRYVDDFVNSHRYIECDDVACRNCHEMNIHIVKILLTEYSGIVRSSFTHGTLSFEKCMKLKQMYDSSEPSKTTEVHGLSTLMRTLPPLLDAILQQNRWHVLQLALIPTICFVFLHLPSRICRIFFIVKKGSAYK